MAMGLLLLALTASAALPSDFVDEPVIEGLTQPSNLEFAPDGRLFVAEKSGLLKVFDSISDTTPDVFADLRSNVHNYWDRGLLGLAIHPDFPAEPYVYVLYTYGVPLDGSLPTWGDGCPNPPGATDDGCVVSGRLSRLEADGNQMTGPEVVMIEDWCQQYPSHSIGDLVFGPDGALYVSAGDGASFNFVDYGQGGGDADSPTPVNPCDDPPDEGGALRSQDLETSGDPVTLDGTIIRIDPLTGEPLPDNPAFGATDENEERIVAYGLRNPYRMTVDPDTGAVLTGDVGWNTWEEVNEVVAPTSTVTNFGWPCYEGGSGTSSHQGGYDLENLSICEDLYSSGTATPSLFAYRHDQDVTPADECPPASPPQGTSSSISGLAFYEGGEYPGSYNGSLFGADYSRGCIWVMYRDSSGDLDPSSVQMFQPDASGPVDLEIGPAGDIFYANINNGEIRRIRFVGDNTPPNASISADTTSGPAPLTVEFDGSGSSDPDFDPIVAYEWDLDDDGTYDDASGAAVEWLYDEPGSYTARLRVEDSRGELGFDSISIQASNSPPTATIDAPGAGFEWHVGEVIGFSGSGTDPEEGPLPESAMSWEWVLHHCEIDESCHQHVIQTFEDVASGTFSAPDHEYPSWLELRLTVVDQFGVSHTDLVELDPETAELTFQTDPLGLDVSFFGDSQTAPFSETRIVGSTVQISTEEVQSEWVFQTWSNGGDRVQTFPAPAEETTYTAMFDTPPEIQTVASLAAPENQTAVVDIDSTDNADSEGAGLSYELTGGADAAMFDVDSSTGVLEFNAAPDFESPADTDLDNVYVVEATVTDTSGLSTSRVFTIGVTDVNDPPVANAGTDKAISLGETVTLDGSGSADPGEGSPLTYQWSILSSPGGSVSSLTNATTATATLTPDEPGSYQLELVVDDGEDTDADTVTVNVSEVKSANLPPEITSDGGGAVANLAVDEGTIVVTDVQSFDPDGDLEGDGLSYALGGVDSSSFQIGGNGELRFVAEPDFESPSDSNGDNVYVVQVSVSDSGGLTDSQEIRVSVLDVAEAYDGIFKDDDGTVFEGAIEWMAREEITLGCNPPANDEYCPGDFVTRAQMAAFFARAFGWSDDGGGDLFVDDDGSVFERAIDLMGAAGVTQGCNPPANDEFCPGEFVTRGQMAAFFKRAFSD